MTSDQNNNSGCLFPFYDDFLPIFMFFFHLNQADSTPPQFSDNDDEDEEHDLSDDEDET